MLKKSVLLAGVELRGYFGFNEARYGRDKKKKRTAILTLAAYVFLTLMMMFYIALVTVGLAKIGMPDVAPVMLCAAVSLVTLAFTFFSAGGALFSLDAYEREIALPVRSVDIVAGRFIAMYIPGAVLSFLAMLAGFGAYAFFAVPPVSAYIMAVLGAVLMPLIPMSAACVLAFAVYGVASVMRHKNIVNVILALAATMAAIVLPYMIPEETDTAALLRLSQAFKDAMQRVYPPSAWFGAGVVNADIASFAVFAIVSVLTLGLTMWVIQAKFADICRRLGSHRSHGNYSLGAQKRVSPFIALYKKELRRYFASPVYVLNTIIGYVMMLAGSVALSVTGLGKLEEIIPGGFIGKLLPFIVALLAAMMPVTSSAVSMEGKQWWIAKTLPVKTSVIFDGKMLVQFTVTLPFYAASCLILSLSLNLEALDVLCLWLTPLCYMLFTAVLGLRINIAMPLFNWDNETAVVKQSAAAGLSMLIGMVSVAIPAVAAALVPGFDVRIACLTACAAVVIAAVLLRMKINSIDLRSIGE